jgi:hypothetical protein
MARIKKHSLFIEYLWLTCYTDNTKVNNYTRDYKSKILTGATLLLLYENRKNAIVIYLNFRYNFIYLNIK